MKRDGQDNRISAILGDSKNLDVSEGLAIFYKHLKANLSLPCQVTGVEDFRWEEFYVIGPGDEEEYEQLKKTQPSYTDTYELLEIVPPVRSLWQISYEDEIGAKVRRISDKKKFLLALSELKATDKQSNNYQLFDDYSVWFVNSH